MGRLYGMTQLQLRIGGRPATQDELTALEVRYPMTESAMFMCREGPAFQEPLDDDEPTIEEVMDDDVDDTATALMAVDTGEGSGDDSEERDE